MANTNVIYVRIDTTLKENAENILNQLGITPSSAIQMLYSQIVLQKGIDSLSTGKQYSADEVDQFFAKEYGV